MKRLAKIIVGFILFLFIAILLVPIFFKDKIKEIIVQEFEKATEATVYFDVDKFGLSMIKNFPDFTVSLGDFGIVGRGIFEGDTLVHVGDLEARVNLSDILFGDQIAIKGVDMDAPRFLIMVLENGAANYDIAKPSEEPVTETESAGGSVDFGINKFSITDGEFVYYDQASGVINQLSGINLKGRGDFASEVFDLKTIGTIDEVGLIYDGAEYVANKSLDIDLILSIDLPNSTYTFKENEFVINKFPLSIDGTFAMLDEGYKMDIGFSSPSTDFKELFSLIPGAYTESFDDIEAAGQVAFSGNVRGTYSEEQMPGFNLDLNVKDGMIHYPDLPESITNVQVDLSVKNASGVVEETSVDLKQMHVDFGSNPFDASLMVLNLKDYPIESKLKGKLNLGDISKMIPVDGLELSGLLEIDASANGKYDSARNIIPAINMNIQLDNGLIRYAELPSPIENINLTSRVRNVSGRMDDTKIDVSRLSMEMDNQPFEAKATIENLDNPKWDVEGKGTLDLEKLMMLYPMEGVSIKGMMIADLKSSGSMADVEARRFRNLPTKGEVTLSNFVYEDESMAQVYSISEANTTFSTRSIEVNSLKGKAGETNYSLNGSISNYLGFALNEETLTGNLDVTADVLNVNEWMTTEESEEETIESEPYEVIRLPENVEFILDSRIDEVVYNQLAMNDISGKFIVRDGALDLNRAKFNALNGTVIMNGKYDSRPEKPSFDFGFDVNSVSIPTAFQSITMIQKMAPVTEKMTGLFNTDFSISGLLNEDMMPDYSSLTGNGLIQVLEASLGQSGIISELGSVSKLANISSATLDKVKMSAEIKDGRLFVKPFKLKLGNYETEIAGSTGIDGSLDYVIGLDVPAGQIGTQLNSLLSSLTNNKAAIGSDVKLDMSLKGSYADPQVGLAGVRSSDGSSLGSTVTASIKTKVDDKKEEVKEEVTEQVEAAKDSAEKVVDAKVDQLKDSAKSTLNSQFDSAAVKLTNKLGIPKDSLSTELKNTKKKAEDVLKGLFKKKKKKKGTGGD